MKTYLEKPAGTCLLNLTIVQFEDRLNFLQGPVLGPTIGNILYNEVLNLEFPPDYKPIAEGSCPDCKIRIQRRTNGKSKHLPY